ncbi:hypothetical protein [Phenylobacterium soli]|uniref:Uncharacterized protein n=2 Tax=Phenylobacterium soli TaxID=2170551 RepID=A0A328AJC2_9CAUL|nr:hypothetical protein DJ017_08725 [Phenylobacterium soli]
MGRIWAIVAALALSASGASAQPKPGFKPPITIPVTCPGVLTLDPHAPAVFRPPGRNVNLQRSVMWDGTLTCLYADPGRMAYTTFELDTVSAKCRPLAPQAWYEGMGGPQCDAGHNCTVACDEG